MSLCVGLFGTCGGSRWRDAFMARYDELDITYYMVMIERDLDPSLDDPIMRKESIRARALVSKHLEKLDLANVYFVDNFDDMLALSIQLHGVAQTLKSVERFRAST